MSVIVSGHAGELASTASKIQVPQELQAFILEHVDAEDNREYMNVIKKSDVFLDVRLEIQLLDNEYLLDRACIQLTDVRIETLEYTGL